MNIDFSMIITPDDKRALALSSRQDTVKMECRSRIYAVVDGVAQINLAAAAAADRLGPEELVIYSAGLDWIEAMRAACLSLIVDTGLDPRSDANWPPVPVGVTILAAQF